MSVVLYKKGDQININGLQCDILKLDPTTFNGDLIPGWFFSAEEAYTDIEPENIEPYKMSKEAEANADLHIKIAIASINKPKENKPKVLKGNAKIRDNARKAGIEDWETARISTLKEKLKA